MDTIQLAAALLVGCLLAVQASVNVQLNGAVKTPYGASTIQLGLATGLLAIVAVALGAFDALSRVPSVPWWHLLGGLASPLYITSGILLFPRLGALAAVGLFVTGQMFASLGLDLIGLLGVAQRPATIGVFAGAAAVLAGITLIIRQPPAARPPGAARVNRSGGAAVVTVAGKRLGDAAWIALGILAGAVLPVQGAINANLRNDLGAPVTVAMFSFVVATVAIAIVLAALLVMRRTPMPQLRPLVRMPWWGWLGGACAAAYVTATFLLIPAMGAAPTVALTVTGQQLFSAVIDRFGLFRMPRRPWSARRVTGLVLLIAGSALVQLA